MDNKGTVQVDVNAVLRKLSLQVADLVSEKAILEAQNEMLLEKVAKLEGQVPTKE